VQSVYNDKGSTGQHACVLRAFNMKARGQTESPTMNVSGKMDCLTPIQSVAFPTEPSCKCEREYNPQLRHNPPSLQKRLQQPANAKESTVHYISKWLTLCSSGKITISRNTSNMPCSTCESRRNRCGKNSSRGRNDRCG